MPNLIKIRFFKKISTRLACILLLFTSFQSLYSQEIDCHQLKKENGIASLNNQPFCGECQSYEKDSILIIAKYSKGKLDGDSAYSKFYRNGLCKSKADYKNGNLTGSKKFQYYGIVPKIGDVYGGYVSREWIVNQKCLSIGLIELDDETIEKISKSLIVGKSDYDISGYSIVEYTFNCCCRPGPDIEIINRTDSLSSNVIKVLKEVQNDYYIFSNILGQIGNDIIILPEMKFKLK